VSVLYLMFGLLICLGMVIVLLLNININKNKIKLKLVVVVCRVVVFGWWMLVTFVFDLEF